MKHTNIALVVYSHPPRNHLCCQHHRNTNTNANTNETYKYCTCCLQSPSPQPPLLSASYKQFHSVQRNQATNKKIFCTLILVYLGTNEGQFCIARIEVGAKLRNARGMSHSHLSRFHIQDSRFWIPRDSRLQGNSRLQGKKTAVRAKLRNARGTSGPSSPFHPCQRQAPLPCIANYCKESISKPSIHTDKYCQVLQYDTSLQPVVPGDAMQTCRLAGGRVRSRVRRRNLSRVHILPQIQA